MTKHLGKGSKIPALKENFTLFSCVICPFAERAHLVLNAKKIPYDVVYLDIWNKAEWYKDVNPTLKVPALKVPGENTPIIESLIIADYLDEKYPDNLLHPKCPFQKALDRALVERFNSTLGTIATIMYPILRNFKEIENVQEMADKLFDGIDIFESELRKRGTKYFGGDKPGMLDYMIWPWCERTIFLPKINSKYSFDSKRFSSYLKWRNLMLEDEAVKACYLTPEFFWEFYQILVKNDLKMEFLDIYSEQREKNRSSQK